MPKTKTKVQTKSKSKPNLLNKLASLDSRGKFLVFIVAFVAIGGSYFAYKSFAATGGISVSATTASLRDGAYVVTEASENSKRNTKIVVIPAGKLNASAGFSGGYASVSGSLAHFIANNTGRQMRLCGFVRAPKTAANLQMINSYGGWEFKPLAISKNYSYVCTGYQRILSAANGFSIPEVRSASATADINVSSLHIEVIN